MGGVYSIILAASSSFENPYEDIEYDVDTQATKRTIDMLSETASLLCGYIAIAIVVLMCIITALDVLFMTIPSYEKLLIRKDLYNPDDNKAKFFLVSKDALAAVLESHTSGKSAMLVYLVKRIRTYVIAVTVLVTIILGSSFLTGIFRKLFSGVYELLS